MHQLIQMVQDKAGIDEGQARTTANTVVGFLKDRLPGPVAGQIDGVIGGQGEGDGSSPMSGIGSMLGR
jgi:hypothetical protein